MKEKKYKVAQAITGYGIGGAERVLSELVSALAKTDESIYIIVLTNALGMLNQYPLLKRNIFCLNITHNPLTWISALHTLHSIIKREKINVLHAHMFHALAIAVIVKILNPKLKLVFTSHSFKGFSFIRKFFIKLTKNLRNADIIFSEAQHKNLNASNTLIIPNSIKVEENYFQHERSPKKYDFIFIGRLEYPKNPQALLRALAQTKNKNLNLLIVGDGYERPDVEKSITALNLNSRVTLYGISTNVQDQLLSARCLILCSVFEGLPMVILEAGAIGLPVISTPVGSIPDLLSDNCGYLTQIDKLSSTMELVAKNQGEALERGRNLHKKILRSYSLEKMVNDHDALYKSLIDMETIYERS